MATDGDGAFSNKPITVPASAVPGDHFVTAIGRTTGLAAQKTFTVRTDWPAFRNSPKHKGFNPLENVLDSSNVSGLDEAWESAATGNSIFSSPAVANGVVFVGSRDNKVYAFPASCSTPCSPLWSSAATGGGISSSPAVANGVVFVGSDDAKLYTYDLAAGPTAPARPDPADLHPDLSLRASG